MFLSNSTPSPQEQTFFSIKAAAARLGIPYWKLLRACKAGLVPCHHLLNSKRYVKLAEVEQAITGQTHEEVHNA